MYLPWSQCSTLKGACHNISVESLWSNLHNHDQHLYFTKYRIHYVTNVHPQARRQDGSSLGLTSVSFLNINCILFDLMHNSLDGFSCTSYSVEKCQNHLQQRKRMSDQRKKKKRLEESNWLIELLLLRLFLQSGNTLRSGFSWQNSLQEAPKISRT